MKQGFTRKVLISLALMLGCLFITADGEIAKASDVNQIPLKIVQDIDNHPYPETTKLLFQTGEYRAYSSFSIEAAGQVKAYFRCGAASDGIGKAWISRDITGNDIVGNIIEIKSAQQNASWFLEQGAYFINIMWNKWNYQVNTALLYEAASTTEDIAISSFDSCNLLTLDSTKMGFLTTTNPNDYYTFSLSKTANIILEYSFDQAIDNFGGAVGSCTLYDQNQKYLTSGEYKQTDHGTMTLAYKLKPGTYYIKMSNLLGSTTLSVNTMYYDIELIPEQTADWTDEPLDIDIETSIDYTEILVLNKDVEESVINNSTVWTSTNEAGIPVDGETFTVKKNGTYSVRITDKYGNHAMKKIKVSNLDITKPKVTGIKDQAAYTEAVSVAITDTQSGLKTEKLTLNGKMISSSFTVSKQGKYILRAYDNIGNYRKITFYIDTTAPTAGVENGRTYTDAVTIKLKDNLSGIKKIIIDDVEEATDTTLMRIYLDGTYTIKLWDKAGNYSKIVFHIKKSY